MDSKFISPSIHDYISKTSLVHEIYFSDYNIRCKYYSISKPLKSKINKFEKLLKSIVTSKISVKNVHVDYYDCPEKRLFVDNPHMINGGVTNLNTRHIIVFREQELARVMWHEFYHLYIDNYLFASENIRLSNFFGRTIALQEAVCDFMATLQVANTKKKIDNEIEYNKKLAKKVYMCIKTSNSNIFSYIVIKSIMLNNDYKYVKKLILEQSVSELSDYIMNKSKSIKYAQKLHIDKTKEFTFNLYV